MAAVRTVLGVGVLVGAVAAAFVGLMVMAGLVAPDDVPLWPSSAPVCATPPGFVVRGGTATTVLATGGELDVEAVNTALAERGHDVVVELEPVEDQGHVRLASASPTAPTEVQGALRTGGTIGTDGATQLVLGPDTFAGGWVVRVRCAAA